MAHKSRIEELGLKITPQYSKPINILIGVLMVLLFPIMIPVVAVGAVLILAFMLAGSLAFAAGRKIAAREWINKDRDFRFQWVRAFINNVLARNLPHYNVPFKLWLYRLTGITVGKGVFLGMNNYMEDYKTYNVFIEDGVTISFNSTFIAHGPRSGQYGKDLRILIRSGSYIGARVTILPGVTIGPNATVGAGSVVVKDIPPGAIAVGNPCKPIRWKPGYGPPAEKKE